MSLFGSIGHFIGGATKTAGRAIGSGVKAASSVTGAIGKGISHIPVVGKPLHSTFNLTVGAPFAVAGGIASGGNISKVLIHQLQSNVQDVKDVAPYAQTILSTVPGVGQGLAGGIGMSLALANGRPLSEAFVEGVKGAIPGGAVAKLAFGVSADVLQGKNVSEVVVNQLPIPDQLKKGLLPALKVAQDVARGKNVPASIRQNAEDLLRNVPGDVGKALTAGIAVGNAVVLQKGRSSETMTPSYLQTLAGKGSERLKGDKIAQAAYEHLPVAERHGFEVGLGLMSISGLSERFVHQIRNMVTGEERKGFDMGLAFHVSRVTRVAPKIKSVKALAGWHLTHGMSGAAGPEKAAMMKVIAVDPDMRAGAKLAVQETASARKSIFTRIAEWFGL